MARLRGAAVAAQEYAAAAAVTAAPSAGGGAGAPARSADAGPDLVRIGERVAHVEAGLVEVRLRPCWSDMKRQGEKLGYKACGDLPGGGALGVCWADFEHVQQSFPVPWEKYGRA